MLYFVTEQETEGKYFGLYQQAVRQQFASKSVDFEEISAFCQKALLEKVQAVSDTPADIWFLAYAHNPVARHIGTQKNGRMYGHAHGLQASLFEPSRLEGYDLGEPELLGFYDGVFVNSEWAKRLIEGAYPEICSCVAVTGFPFDAEKMVGYRCRAKRENMLVFNQRFDVDKLHILVVHLADIFTCMGYHVVGLLPESEYEKCLQQRHKRVLLREGQKRGLSLHVSSTKEEYYRQLARATVMITTPLAETLSVATLEAAALNVRTIVPDFGPFVEFVPSSERYRPYSIEDIMTKVFAESDQQINLKRFHPSCVVGAYLQEMGL